MGAGTGSGTRTTADELRTTAPVFVCATDEAMRARIEAALELGGYAHVTACGSTGELIEEARRHRPALVVLAFAFEPFIPDAEVELISGELDGTPLVLVASGFVGSSCRRLVRAGLEGLVQGGQIEHALVATIDAVLADQLCVPASMRGTLAHPVFSHREKQVLE